MRFSGTRRVVALPRLRVGVRWMSAARSRQIGELIAVGLGHERGDFESGQRLDRE